MLIFITWFTVLILIIVFFKGATKNGKEEDIKNGR